MDVPAPGPTQDDIEEIRRKLGLDEMMASVPPPAPMWERPAQDMPIAPPAPPAADPVPAAPAAMDLPKDLPKNLPKEIPKDLPKELPSDIPKDVPKTPLELPDFTDEDFAQLERTLEPLPPVPAPAYSPKAAPSGEGAPVPKEEPKVDWNADTAPVPLASETPAPPLPPAAAQPFGRLAPAMFISGEEYLAIADGIKGVRRDLRKNDDLLREIAGRHAQADEQLERAASDIADIQERLMALDGALFQE